MILDSEEQRQLLMRFIEEAEYTYDNAREYVALEDAIKNASIITSGECVSDANTLNPGEDIYVREMGGEPGSRYIEVKSPEEEKPASPNWKMMSTQEVVERLANVQTDMREREAALKEALSRWVSFD